jgi:membrane-associated phospholipid phosphatase
MKWRRGIAIGIAYILFCLIYLGAPRLALQPARPLLPSLVDRAIPFAPWTIAIYLSQFAILFLALWRARDATPAFVAIAVATLISAVIFILYPTTIIRPPTQNAAFRALWLFDVPTNCFPSLHVALAMIAAALWPDRATRRIAIIWSIAIAISTLTTKQHYAIDVVGGAAVGTIAILATRVAVLRPRPARPPRLR